MTDIYVSDLFGKKATNNSPIIAISSSESINLMNKIAKSQDTSIWAYDMQKISEILNLRNIDAKNFASMGHVFCLPNKDVTSIILGNLNWFQTANEYEIVTPYSNGKIIKPILKDGTNTMCSLGLCFINDAQSSLPTVCVLPVQLFSNINLSSPSEGDLDATEFSLLASKKLGLNVINRNKLLKNESRNIKLMSYSGNYLTFVDSDVKTKQRQKSLQQSFAYNAQGELTTDGKCLTYAENNVSAETCDEQHLNKNQKWLLSHSKILPSNDFGKCLEVGKTNPNAYLRECDNTSQNQDWSTESPDSDANADTDFIWDKYQGKTVVLVENDNPWYVNTDTTYKMPYVTKQQNLRDDILYRNNQDYENKFVMDPKSPTLGYGYSFSDRGGIPCSGVEGFGNISQNPMDLQILAIILILAILIFVYKYYKGNFN